MATYWKLVADIFMPIAVILLVLLTLPFPRKIRKGIVLMVDKVLSFPLIGNFQLLHVLLVVTGLSFAETARQTFYLQQQRATDMVETPNVVTGLLAKKWRSERNFWLALYSWSAWLFLAVFYRTQVHVLRLEEQLHGPTGKPARTAIGSGAGASAARGKVPSAPPLEPEVQMASLKKGQ